MQQSHHAGLCDVRHQTQANRPLQIEHKITIRARSPLYRPDVRVQLGAYFSDNQYLTVGLFESRAKTNSKRMK
jgi:hypothetical protein